MTAAAVPSESPSSSPFAITIAILTFRRLDDLRQVVPAVLEQVREPTVHGIEILVVDNDPDGSGEQYVRTLDDPAVRYVNERRPGIAAARNRALAECADRDLLIFIDDDERPYANWLSALVSTYEGLRPAAVVGPVLSQFDAEPDAWITQGRFFKRRRLTTGTSLDVAATNNLLLDLARVRGLGLKFDEAFGLSGGSDTLFTRSLYAAGEPMIWCDEAVVIDRVPVQRTTRDWVMKRAVRSGNSWTRTSLVLAGSGRRRAVIRVESVARGLVRIVGGGGQFLAGAVVRSIGWRARGARTAARGAGMLGGAFGYVRVEYRREHPASGAR